MFFTDHKDKYEYTTRGISLKVNIIAWLEFKATVQHFNHYAMATHPIFIFTFFV